MSPALGFRYSHTIGLLAQSGRGFSLPVDCACGPDGVIYVLNRGTPTQRNTHVTICTVDSEYRADFGSYGAGDGQFIWPTAIAVDREGCVYVSSESEHRIQKFSPAGTFLGTWGTPGDGEGEFDGPSGLAFDREDNLYVVDHFNSRVQQFTKDGTFLLQWGGKGDGPGQFDLPWGIGLDAAGYVYVADWHNDRVQKFTKSCQDAPLLAVGRNGILVRGFGGQIPPTEQMASFEGQVEAERAMSAQCPPALKAPLLAAGFFTADGTYLATYGTAGEDEGAFHRPSSVAMDRDGNMYVADWGNNRVQVLGHDGGCRAMLVGDAGLSKWAEEMLPANPDYLEARAQARNREVERFLQGPTSVKLDDAGSLYIVDSCRYRLQIYRRVY